MSYLSEQDVVCGFCKHPNSAEIWSSINVQEDPELKDILLGGELNLIECEACKKVFYAEQFLLYHDSTTELMAFVYPYEHRNEKSAWEEKTKMDFSASQFSYEPVSLFGMDELVQLVEQEEESDIQGQIVEHMASQNGIRIKKLKPSLARRWKTPLVLPFADTSPFPSRDSVIEALDRIHKQNDRLTIYQSFHTYLKNNPSFSFEFAE